MFIFSFIFTLFILFYTISANKKFKLFFYQLDDSDDENNEYEMKNMSSDKENSEVNSEVKSEENLTDIKTD